MPFYAEYSTKRRTITLTGIQGTITMICAPADFFITMEAFLNDTFNLRNTELLWEQIYGNPIVINNETQRVSNFQFTDSQGDVIDVSDKIFRFWIHKDTPGEDYLDIKVFHTPTSELSMHFQSDIVFPSTADSGVQNLSYVAVLVGFEFEVTLDYDLPVDSPYYDFRDRIEIYYHATDPNSLAHIDTLNQPLPTSYVGSEGYYRVDIVYVLPGGKEETFESIVIDTIVPPDLRPIFEIVDDPTGMSFTSETVGHNIYGYLNRSATDGVGMTFISEPSIRQTSYITVDGNLVSTASTSFNSDMVDFLRSNLSGVGSPA